MDVSPILDPLNEAQRTAVTSEPLPTLVIAGAGSGKTRVLVHRIAWLCEIESVSPFNMLVVTFTNKAAAEMRARAEKMLNHKLGGMWLGTFHGISHRLLRSHWQEAGLEQNFQILDSDDQLRLIKRTILDLKLDDTKWPPKSARWYINTCKDEGKRPQDLQNRNDLAERELQLIRIYTAYQKTCEQTGMVDFAELLLRSWEMLQQKTKILDHYQARFHHILVDEFQDTNSIQYKWLKTLAGDSSPIFAVGDDDQSIYGWRGARIENIHNFETDYTNTQVFKLEQNYRSTNTILSAANSLIRNNQGRMGKKLWTIGNSGEPICLHASFNEQDEARFVADRVKHWTADGRRNEIAVLYRSNAQSRVFEAAFISEGIPYRVYGGLRFFERAEIKDALSYLRLARNPDDDPSFERIVNVPARGIGQSTVARVRDFARRHQLAFWQAADKTLQAGVLAAREANALQGFLRLVRKMSQDLNELKLAEQVDYVIRTSGLVEYYRSKSDEISKSRLENLQELVMAAKEFRVDDELHAGMLPIDAFLTHAALEAGEDRQGTQSEDCVHFMTLHAAKGLEFPLVFIVGLEEGLFPSSMSLEEGRLEEERRLCYVGITRAQQQLVLTYAESRRRYGSESYYNKPSRFIDEIPPELVTEARPRAMIARPTRAFSQADSFAENTGIRVGGRVAHAKFGEGVVLDCEGKGKSARVQVRFEEAGSKWLVLAYADLDILAR